MSTPNYSIPMPFDCDLSYNPTVEVLKYIGTISYLIPGLILHIFVLKSILFTKKEYFKKSSFFTIFAMDSVASIIAILLDICFSRLFLYVSPLCSIVGPYFWNPTFILKTSYYIFTHARLAKSVAQMFMVFNRMTCVLVPTFYSSIWTRLTPIAITMIIILPLGGTWFLLVSPRFYVIPSYGGFAVNYIRAVPWASVSMFQSIYILTALCFTILCTSITLFKLIFLHVRVKSAEKSLCFTSIFISFTFLLVAATQLFYILCIPCRSSDYLFTCQFLAFDSFTVGSALILMLSNGQLRESMFSSSKSDDRVFKVSKNNSFTHG